MAIASCSVKIISRGKGRSAVAAAAYRAGEEMQNAYDGLAHNYTRKAGITHTDILTPDGAPDWAQDRQQLWNMVEQTERRKDAQLAREVMIALPQELSTNQNTELARDYAQKFVEQGMIADVSVHDNRDGNPHAHILLTLRPLEGDSFGKKCRDWNSTEKLIAWREQYAELTNQYLERHGYDQRIDARSYEELAIDQIPTIHLGHHAHSMEKKGIHTERGDINREIQEANREIGGINAEIAALQKECEKEQEIERENQLKSVHLQTEWQEPKKPSAYEYPTQPPMQHHERLGISEQRKLAAQNQEQERQGERQQPQPPSVHRPHEGRTLAQQRRVAQERERQRQVAPDQAHAEPRQHHERPSLSEQRRLAALEKERQQKPPPLRRHREEMTLAQQRKAAQEPDLKKAYENPVHHAKPHKSEHEGKGASERINEEQQHHIRRGEENREHERKRTEELERRRRHDRKM